MSNIRVCVWGQTEAQICSNTYQVREFCMNGSWLGNISEIFSGPITIHSSGKTIFNSVYIILHTGEQINNVSEGYSDICLDRI